MMMSLLVAPASPKTQEQQGIQQFGRKIRKTSNNTLSFFFFFFFFPAKKHEKRRSHLLTFSRKIYHSNRQNSFNLQQIPSQIRSAAPFFNKLFCLNQVWTLNSSSFFLSFFLSLEHLKIPFPIFFPQMLTIGSVPMVGGFTQVLKCLKCSDQLLLMMLDWFLCCCCCNKLTCYKSLEAWMFWVFVVCFRHRYMNVVGVWVFVGSLQIIHAKIFFC